jgi:hypothetical protein
MTAWTPTEDKLARDLLAAGIGKTEIARRLGRTRNSIIGFFEREVRNPSAYVKARQAENGVIPLQPPPPAPPPEFPRPHRQSRAAHVLRVANGIAAKKKIPVSVAPTTDSVAAAKGNIGKACEVPALAEPTGHASQAGFQVGASEGAQPPAGARAETGPGVDDLEWQTPTSGRVSVLDVSPSDCRWPLGDPGDIIAFRYCGRPQHGGYGPYCKHHFEMAYTPRGRRVVEERIATKRWNSHG